MRPCQQFCPCIIIFLMILCCHIFFVYHYHKIIFCSHFQESVSVMTRMAHLVTALPDLYKLHIGWYDAPLSDLLTTHVLTSVSNKYIKVLLVRSSSPVLLQEALLSINKMKTLHSLYLRHDTNQASACSHSILHGLHFLNNMHPFHLGCHMG